MFLLFLTCIKILCSDVCKGKGRKHVFTSQTAEKVLWMEKCKMAPQVRKLIFFYTINSNFYLCKAFLRGNDWKWCQCQRLIRFFEKRIMAPLVKNSFFQTSKYLIDTYGASFVSSKPKQNFDNFDMTLKIYSFFTHQKICLEENCNYLSSRVLHLNLSEHLWCHFKFF